jgi:hypothetical protein
MNKKFQMVMFGFIEISIVVKIAKTAGLLDRKNSMDTNGMAEGNIFVGPMITAFEAFCTCLQRLCLPIMYSNSQFFKRVN